MTPRLRKVLSSCRSRYRPPPPPTSSQPKTPRALHQRAIPLPSECICRCSAGKSRQAQCEQADVRGGVVWSLGRLTARSGTQPTLHRRQSKAKQSSNLISRRSPASTLCARCTADQIQLAQISHHNLPGAGGAKGESQAQLQ
jgi:hypothetical protein